MRRWWAQLDPDGRDRWIAFMIAAFCASLTADLVGGRIELNLLSGFALRVVVLIAAVPPAHMVIRRIRGLRDGSSDVPSDGP